MVAIELGADPQLDILGHATVLGETLNDFQIGFHIKDRMWEIIQSTQCSTGKAGRLLSLGLEEAICGPVLELLLAESRSKDNNVLE